MSNAQDTTQDTLLPVEWLTQVRVSCNFQAFSASDRILFRRPCLLPDSSLSCMVPSLRYLLGTCNIHTIVDSSQAAFVWGRLVCSASDMFPAWRAEQITAGRAAAAGAAGGILFIVIPRAAVPCPITTSSVLLRNIPTEKRLFLSRQTLVATVPVQ